MSWWQILLAWYSFGFFSCLLALFISRSLGRKITCSKFCIVPYLSLLGPLVLVILIFLVLFDVLRIGKEDADRCSCLNIQPESIEDNEVIGNGKLINALNGRERR